MTPRLVAHHDYRNGQQNLVELAFEQLWSPDIDSVRMMEASGTRAPPNVQNIPINLAYKRGEGIGGRYTVLEVLGKGGFGVVYRVRDKVDNRELALKTFRDEFILDPGVKLQFRKEALTWIGLGRHSFILEARGVHEFEGRLFVAMEYVAPDEDGLVTLQDHIKYHGRNLNDRLISTWAIEFCHGMTHAHAHGITAHRDIKPQNILVESGVFIKISDFGLAASIEKANFPRSFTHALGLSTFPAQGGTMCGTLGYIAPEIYAGQAATVRSDIYSFGAVLWQLCTGSQRPPFWEALRDVAADAYAASAILSRSQLSPVQSIFWTVIGRCLRLDPNDRYQDFDEVKNGIRTVLDQAGHRKLDFVVNTAPAFDNLVNRGASLRTLGRFDEALACYDAAIQLKPNAAAVWVNKGNLHSSMKHPAEAMQAYDHAIQLDPTCQLAWFNKGIQLQHNNENAEAIRCFDRLIELNPQHSLAWNRKGRSLVAQDEIEKAMACHRKALEINPNDEIACTYLAECLFQIGSKAQSLRYYDRAIEANSKHRDAWIGKAELLIELTRFDEALRCLDFALMLNSDDLATVNMKAIVLCRSGRQREAIPLFDMLLANSTTDMDVLWANKGNALAELGKWSDALSCYDRALAVNPNYAPARSQHDLVVRELKSSS